MRVRVRERAAREGENALRSGSAVVEVVEVVAVVEHEDVVDEGGREEVRPKRRRNA